MSFTGVVAELIVGYDGLTGSKNLSQVLPSQLLRATNVTYENGPMQKEPGATKYNSTPISGSPSVIGGWDWWPTTALQRMIVVTSAGNVLKDTGGGTFGTTLASGLTLTDVVPVFVQGGKEVAANSRKLFLFSEKNQVKVLVADGVTMASISAPPADWTANFPVGGFIHEGSLWGYGNDNDPHRLYKSLSTNHEDFTTTPFSVAIYPGEGQRIAWAISYKGLIVVAKYPRGIYYVDTTDPSSANWKVLRLTDAVGSPGVLSYALIENDIVFVESSATIGQASAVIEFGSLGGSNLSQRAEMYGFIQDNFNLSRLKFIRGAYSPARRQVHFAWARTGGAVNDARLVIDFMRLDLPRFRFSDRDICESLWLRLDNNNIHRLVSGDNAGTVWLMENEVRSKAGGYLGEFQVPHTDFSQLDTKYGTLRKEGKFLEIVAEPKGNWNITADIIWDGKLKQTVQFNMGVSGAVLGTFIIGTDALGSDQVLNRKRRIMGGGRRFSVSFKNGGDGQDFSIARAYLHFQVGSEALKT